MGKRKNVEETPKPKRRKRRVGRLLFLLLIGGVGALVLSEDVRNRALDALFGSEQEFQYTPPAPASGDGAGSGA